MTETGKARDILARTLWGEARGESPLARSPRPGPGEQLRQAAGGSGSTPQIQPVAAQCLPPPALATWFMEERAPDLPPR